MRYGIFIYMLVSTILLQGMEEREQSNNFQSSACYSEVVPLAIQAADKIVAINNFSLKLKKYISIQHGNQTPKICIDKLSTQECITIGNDFLKTEDKKRLNQETAELVIKRGWRKYILENGIGASVSNSTTTATCVNNFVRDTAITIKDLKKYPKVFAASYLYLPHLRAIAVNHSFATCVCALNKMHESHHIFTLSITAPIDHFPLFATLRSLEITFGRIRILPEELFLLHKLQKIDFSYNEIEEIPASIQQLKKLENAYFNKNKLRKLPAELYTLKQLKSFWVADNPLEDVSNKKDCVFYGISKEQWNKLAK